MTSRPAIIVLCGGAGRRVGGQDKPLLLLNGEPLIGHLAKRLAGAGRLLISANRNADRYAEYGEVIPDRLSGQQGPLAGVAACLAHVHEAVAFVCPGDCPLVTPALVERLVDALPASGATRTGVVCAHDGQHRQPLHLALGSEAQGALQHYLDRGGRSARGWLDSCGAATVDCRDLSRCFVDVDSPADLAALRKPG